MSTTTLRPVQSGFTIVELLVSIAISTILSTVLLGISLNILGSTIQSQVAAELAVSSHYTLRAVVEDLRVADSIGATNNLTDTNSPSGGWTLDSSNGALIIRNPAINQSDDIIYNDLTGDPYTNEFVYYLSDGSLLRRAIENTAATDNQTRTSCPPAIASSSCPSDREYTDYVSNFSFVMYDNTNTETTDPLLARSVQVSLTLERKVYGETVSLSNTINTKLRN